MLIGVPEPTGNIQRWNAMVDVLIDQYINSAQILTESKNVQDYLTGKPDYYQSAVQSFTKIGSTLIEGTWELE